MILPYQQPKRLAGASKYTFKKMFRLAENAIFSFSLVPLYIAISIGGLFLVLARHLRYFTEPVWFWVNIIQPFGKYASFMMVAGLAGLLARRFLVDRVRYISTPSDYLMLVLLLAIGLSGMLMTFVAHTDIVALKAFFMGLMYFDVQPLPQDPILLAHLALVALLMVIFPISKLLHAPGVFFSPTRNQVDNPRERRHVAAWAARLDQNN